MKERTLGNTSLKVSELSLGGGQFYSGSTVEQVREVIKAAFSAGINYIDTAAGYDESEKLLGQVLADVCQPCIISTKLGGYPEPFDPRDPGALRASVRHSLRLLGRDYIDILMIHEPDRPRHFDWWTDWDNFTGPVLEVMDELKAEGIVRFAGLGGSTAYELAHIINTGRFDVVLTAFNYSLLWREAEIAVLPAARANNMGIIIGSPLQQGALARRYDEQIAHDARWLSPPRRHQYKALYSLLDELGMSIIELAVRFVISNPDISCVLTGARTAQELKENLAVVAKGPLSADLLGRLDEIYEMVPFRPFEEPFGLPFNGEYRGPSLPGR